MNALISLLPPPYGERVKNIWDDLEQQFGIVGVKRAPYPHFSWQGAERYEEEGLQLTLSTIAARISPFMLETNGIAVFPGNQPVVSIAILQNENLLRLHQQLWAAARPLGKDFNSYYAPGVWQPHITLAMEDLSLEMLDDVMAYLSQKPFDWKFQIKSLSYYQEDSTGTGKLAQQYNFRVA